MKTLKKNPPDPFPACGDPAIESRLQQLPSRIGHTLCDGVQKPATENRYLFSSMLTISPTAESGRRQAKMFFKDIAEIILLQISHLLRDDVGLVVRLI